MAAAMSEFDLTPQQGWAIKLLSGPKALAMSDLAEMMGCDASNITSIVDRLEARGFVERRAAASDRRVKELVLTPCGRELYERVAERMEQPPPMIDNLSESDKEQLRDILRRALDSVEL
jgi:DNA-binding MarR family transcriptional regulator